MKPYHKHTQHTLFNKQANWLPFAPLLLSWPLCYHSGGAPILIFGAQIACVGFFIKSFSNRKGKVGVERPWHRYQNTPILSHRNIGVLSSYLVEIRSLAQPKLELYFFCSLSMSYLEFKLVNRVVAFVRGPAKKHRILTNLAGICKVFFLLRARQHKVSREANVWNGNLVFILSSCFLGQVFYIHWPGFAHT